MPNGWERQYGLNPNGDDANADSDNDNSRNLWEYLAGTSPTNADSSLRITDARQQSGNQYVISWSSVSNHYYMILKSTNLANGFFCLQSNITATPFLNSHTDAVNGAGATFYRIGLDP
jgi:hypothetical protein